VRVETLQAADVRPLRQSVLRPHQTVEELVWGGDDDPATLHVGVRDGAGRLVAVGSVAPDPGPHGDWRVRGMAVEPPARGSGAGRAVLDALLAHARERGGTRAWCNARTNVQAFYERAGFAAVGEPFDLPHIGPHVVMTRDLVSPPASAGRSGGGA
jgi:predicted GNAT family N-acyltransferase